MKGMLLTPLTILLELNTLFVNLLVLIRRMRNALTSRHFFGPLALQLDHVILFWHKIRLFQYISSPLIYQKNYHKSLKYARKRTSVATQK